MNMPSSVEMLFWSSLLLPRLTCANASSLPHMSIYRQNNRGHSAALSRSIGISKRQDAISTNIFQVYTWNDGGGYYANITVGTPPQPQVVLIDTGSSDLYFDASYSASCSTHGPNSCRGGSFDLNRSSTYVEVQPSPAFDVSYGDGSSASGPYGADTIGIGNFEISNVQFGVGETVISTTGYAIGLLGMGYASIEATEDIYPNLPEVMVLAGVTNSRLYSIYLNDADSTSGSVLFGGIDTTKYTGNLVTIDLLPSAVTGIVNQFITVVTGMSITINGHTTSVFSDGTAGVHAYDSTNSLPVLLDTGSSDWVVPTEFYKEFIVPLFSYVDDDGFCSCSYRYTGDSISLEFNGQISIEIPISEFILPIYNYTTRRAIPYNDGTDACRLAISPSPSTSEGFLTLGDAILRSMYLVFDLDGGQVSIAQAAINSTASPNFKVVQAGPSGVANAASNVVTAPSNTWPVSPQATDSSGNFSGTTLASTIGTATGTAAVPFEDRVISEGRTSELGWNGVWTVLCAMLMATFGVGLVL